MGIVSPRLLNFLQTELEVAPAAIALALRQAGPDLDLLPMILWQYGLVNLTQLDYLFDWLHTEPTRTLARSGAIATRLGQADSGTPRPATHELPTAA